MPENKEVFMVSGLTSQLLKSVSKDTLTSATASELATRAANKPMKINLQNIPDRPFSIVIDPLGEVADWGVGGA